MNWNKITALSVSSLIALGSLSGCVSQPDHGSPIVKPGYPIVKPTESSTPTAKEDKTTPAAKEDKTSSFTAKPLTPVTESEQSSLKELEVNTAETLTKLITIALTDESNASDGFIKEFDSTKDPVEARAIFEKYRPAIQEVNKYMLITPGSESYFSQEDMLISKGITDPKEINEIKVFVEYMIFTSKLYKANHSPGKYTIEAIPGSFRTIEGETFIPDESIVVKDENGGIVDFFDVEGKIILESSGQVLNFSEFRNPGLPKDKDTAGKNWVTDKELFDEYKHIKATFSRELDREVTRKDMDALIIALNEDSKYGGTFKATVIDDVSYVMIEHPASLLGQSGEVLYRFDRPSTSR